MLEGKIGEFSLPDIFQLIALTKKSGALNVSSTQAEGRILFKGGEICFAVADVARVAIGARLVQAGLASEEQVLEILERQRAHGATGNLSQALLEGADVDEGALDAFIRSSIEDAVFDLMRLTEASFSFDPSEETDATVGLTVSTEHLIIEGGRRMGEWTSIREHIPSPDAVLAVSPAAGQEGEVALSGEQWRVLALVDGHRTVRELVELTGQGDFATAQLLSGMVTQGMVEVAGADGAGALAAMFARRDLLERIEALELGAAPPAPRRPVVADPTPRVEIPEPAILEPVADAVIPDVPALPELPDVPEVADVDEVVTPDPAAEAKFAAPEPAPELLAPTAEPELAPSADLADLLGDSDSGSRDSVAEVTDAPASEQPADGLVARLVTEPVDRAAVARELASLGLDDAPAKSAKAPAAAGDHPAEEIRRLTRDEDVNKGLLLRLIDGVKGA